MLPHFHAPSDRKHPCEEFLSQTPVPALRPPPRTTQTRLTPDLFFATHPARLQSSKPAKPHAAAAAAPSRLAPGKDAGGKALFRDLSISNLTLRAIVEEMGYETMTEVQRLTLPVILDGQDCLAKAKTGTGKARKQRSGTRHEPALRPSALACIIRASRLYPPAFPFPHRSTQPPPLPNLAQNPQSPPPLPLTPPTRTRTRPPHTRRPSPSSSQRSRT